MVAIHCESCNKIIMDKNESGQTRLRTKLVVFGDRTLATCPQCKHPNEVPIYCFSSSEKVKNVIITNKKQ